MVTLLDLFHDRCEFWVASRRGDHLEALPTSLNLSFVERVDERTGEAREVFVAGGSRVNRCGEDTQLLVTETVELLEQRFSNQPLAIGEVPVERSFGNADPFTHILDAKRIDPLVLNDFNRDVDEFLPGVLAGGPSRAQRSQRGYGRGAHDTGLSLLRRFLRRHGASLTNPECACRRVRYSQPMITGRCLCEAVTFELTGDIIATAVCHCDRCQRQGGSAFSVNLVAHESQLKVNGELKTFEERGERKDDVYVRRKFCPGCGSPIVSELAKSEGIIAVKAGVLDDKSSVKPTVEAWCVDRQPWVSLPGMAMSMERETP